MEKYKCSHCASTFDSKKELKRHKIQFHNDLIKENICSICSRQFTSKSGLKYHLNTAHDGKKKCKICKISIPEEDMGKHMEFVHQQKDLESDKENDQVETDKQLEWIDNNPLKTEKTGKHTCEVCRKPFSSKQAMQTHLINIHKYDSIQARKGTNTYVKQNYKENLEESDFLNSQNVVVEKPGKNERIRQFSCKLCSTEFATKAIFDEHILSVHLETPQLKCHLCHKSFQLERKLKSHIKIVHEFLNEDEQEESESNSMNSDSAKGQLISKCLFGTFNSPKKRTKNLDFT